MKIQLMKVKQIGRAVIYYKQLLKFLTYAYPIFLLQSQNRVESASNYAYYFRDHIFNIK